VDLSRVGRDGLERLRETLTGFPGACEAFLHLIRSDGSETIVAVPSSLRVAASDEVVEAVERVVGSGMLSFR
jgi:DNA polymerase-3 subunit alpha